MDVLNLDLSHYKIFEMSIADLKSTEALYKSHNYPQSIYFLQQSVEKSCKYIGLTFRAISEEKLKKIGHNPHIVFRKIFCSDEMKQLGGASEFHKFEQMVQDLNFDERVESLTPMLNSELEDVIKYTSDPIGVFLDYIDHHPLKDSLGINIRDEVEKSLEIVPRKIIENIAIKHIDKINNFAKANHILLILGFLVWGLEEKVRYPDMNNSPMDEYNENSAFVKALPMFIKAQANALVWTETYFAEEE